MEFILTVNQDFENPVLRLIFPNIYSFDNLKSNVKIISTYNGRDENKFKNVLRNLRKFLYKGFYKLF